jgi:hypothetical protein
MSVQAFFISNRPNLETRFDSVKEESPMKPRIGYVVVGFLSLVLPVLSLVPLTLAQMPTQTASALPRLVRFGGTVKDLNGSPLTGVVGITFALYSEQTGGASLWLETQNVTADSNGHYTALLGLTMPDGLPADLFTSEQAHWVGVQVSGQAEQPRVLLVSAPYALKAGDAETIGGLPPSAFMLAEPAAKSGTAGAAAPAPTGTQGKASATSATATDVTTTGGTAYYLPMFNGTSTITDSVMFQVGTGSTAKIGINTTTPTTTLGVNGAATIGGLTIPAEGTATAAAGTISHPLNLYSSVFNSGTGKAVNQTFTWQTEPAGNDTATPSGTLNLLFGSGSSGPAETGVNITSNGQINGVVVNAATSFDLGGNPFAFGSYVNQNAFLGFAGNFTTTARLNTAVGYQALASITTGGTNNVTANTAVGYQTLLLNTTGYNNTAVGTGALVQNVGGFQNTAVGEGALTSNSSGYSNTAMGVSALVSNSVGYFNTANGFYALFNNTGNNNTGSGFEVLYNSTGNNNTASGAYALYGTSPDASTGGSNTAIGYAALYGNTSGSDNTAIGTNALYRNSTGTGNIAIGTNALLWDTDGSSNIAIGINATTPVFSSVSNSTAIGYYALVAESNAMSLGSTAAENGVANILVGIDVSQPTNILTVLKGGGDAIADGWSTYSSRRWKTNIQTLPGALAKVEQLRGVSYDLKDSGKHEIGVIAEEVGAVVPEVVSYEENGKDARGVDYSRLTALLIEATKEQQRELAKALGQIRQQQSLLRAQSAAMRSLKAEVRETRETLRKVKAQVAEAQPGLIAAK